MNEPAPTRVSFEDHCYLDAFCLNMIRKPWDFDVAPMENQLGDITSDLVAGLVGGMGYAPSGDVGDEHAMFQPSYGTAPDIAGSLTDAALEVEAAVDDAFASGKVRPYDVGCTDGSAAITRAIMDFIGRH